MTARALTPDQLRKWIDRGKSRACWLRLVHKRVEGDIVVQQWGNIELHSTDVDVVADVLDAASNYADAIGEACGFLVQWVDGDNHQIASIGHYASPLGPVGMDAAKADTVTGNALVATLLRHIEVQQATHLRALGPILQAYEKALGMQLSSMERMHQTIERQSLIIQQAALQPHQTDEERAAAVEVEMQKAKAYEKLSELGPDIGRLAILAARRAMGVGGVDSEDPGPS